MRKISRIVKTCLIIFLITCCLVVIGKYHGWISLNSIEKNFVKNEIEIQSEEFSKKANLEIHKSDPSHSNLPLILQKDKRWAETAYGTELIDNDIAHNGCALASLAMISSYWENKKISPLDILKWAGNKYYQTNMGTSWDIFSDFAEQNKMKFQNLSSNFDVAYEKLKEGYPLIASVTTGTFTKTGHIIVLTLNKDGQIKVYDPNDTKEKGHYKKIFPAQIFRNEVRNYWLITK